VSTCSKPGRPDLRAALAAVPIVLVLAGLAFSQEKPPPLPKEAQDKVKEFQKHANAEEPRTRAEQM
jgi:hypothetical protein